MPPPPTPRTRRPARVAGRAHPHAPLLTAPGWTSPARSALERLIRRGAGRRLPVVFDFDNTLVYGDIGEATLAVLVASGRLKPEHLSATLSPSFRLPDGSRISPDVGPDLTAYYEAYLAPTAHGSTDPTPLANGYAWAVEVMEGLRVTDVVRATQTAFRQSVPGELRPIVVTPGRTSFPAPFFFPEMVELVAALREAEFDVWIVSASNVWSVRWMVQHGLNALLRQRGIAQGVAPDHVLGVSTLLRDGEGRLYKDALLVREEAAYASLAPGATRRLKLTSRLQFPVPTYSGKVAAIWAALGRRPFLAVGDSPGDHAMLTFSDHRLWIARLDKPAYQQATAELARQTDPNRWIVQPTLSRPRPGLICAPRNLRRLLPEIPLEIGRSLSLWRWLL